jgi:transcriptional regulator of acetoin/glycerol metabolism
MRKICNLMPVPDLMQTESLLVIQPHPDDLQHRGSIQTQYSLPSLCVSRRTVPLCFLAEMKRELIVERTQAGLQAARKRGRVGGRPRVDKKSVDRALKLYESKEYSVAEITELTGVSKATLYRRLKDSSA